MDVLWWSLTALLIVVGFAGTILPFLPGTTLILAGAVLHHFTIRSPYEVNWWTLSGLTVLTILSYVVDFASGVVGAKWYGATRWGAVGGLLGAVVGLFFGPVGILLGPLAGVMLGELLGGKGLLPAGKSTWGTVIGTTVGIAARVILAAAMVGWYLFDAFLLRRAP